ncbi:endonuclease [uncultured phage_MedDCM-OCT-S39-C11]|uniref:Endonuclease n=1 Tax=uncultured phage_MedDCM-OCT-S39-C11 TaxID=2740805 RepID=A0A6S4PGY8_9CAUD|nr:endonuclease [uncultured phage_MedDCM-OCT-S39-C11]BAQ94483.1 endonuclease [uncultured phage_MedDCM-OCT-S39-C11]
MFNRFNQHRERRKKGEFRSKLEGEISQALQQQGLDIDYEKDRFDFYLKRFYTPDFRVKGKAFDFWIEVKGYWPSSERSKMLAVIQRHPTLPIFVALQRPHMRISKTSKTSYCQWCSRYGLAWCPTPIPDDFLSAWVTGQRLTFRAPTQKDAAAQTELPLVETTVQSIALPADSTS